MAPPAAKTARSANTATSRASAPSALSVSWRPARSTASAVTAPTPRPASPITIASYRSAALPLSRPRRACAPRRTKASHAPATTHVEATSVSTDNARPALSERSARRPLSAKPSSSAPNRGAAPERQETNAASIPIANMLAPDRLASRRCALTATLGRPAARTERRSARPVFIVRLPVTRAPASLRERLGQHVTRTVIV